MRVLKWSVPVDDKPHRVGAGDIMHVACQNGPDSVEVWTLEFEHEPQTILAQVFGTGQRLPAWTTSHLGSVVTAQGALVWHVFEVLP